MKKSADNFVRAFLFAFTQSLSAILKSSCIVTTTSFMKPAEIFINEYGRLRSGWRFVVFSLLFVFFSFLAAAIADFVFSGLAASIGLINVMSSAIGGFLSFAAAILVGWLCGKHLEALPFRALGAWFTKSWLKDLTLGLLLGALSLALAVLIAVSFGGLSFDFNQTNESSAVRLTLLVSLIIFAAGAAFEEALFRGYILQTFARANLAWLAIVLTSLFFAVAHLNNDNVTFLSTANTALAGIWFGIAYLKTRTLWFVFGLHLMWNWFQGAIFGIEVSGITAFTTAPLLKEIDAGPVWLTGETYGIEGGIACTIALLISIALIWFLPILKPTVEMLALTNKENPNSGLI
jgi:hypothetical protein